jgi:hypothetical protein
MWSIGIYTGESPYKLRPQVSNPVLVNTDVTDRSAQFVADPFMIGADPWFMFFEVLNNANGLGEIGLASSVDGLAWNYEQIVLSEPFHLSYPYVFEWRRSFYMIPETLGANAVCLYKADDFPLRWSLAARLIEGQYADPSIIFFDGLYWMFVCSTPYLHDTLRLFFAEELTGPWREHPRSPIVTNDRSRARPGGRVLTLNDRVVRFTQDCTPQYGTRVRAIEVVELSTTRYVEVERPESPILQPAGAGWNGHGMHHIDAHRLPDGNWLACVDGNSPIG